ncbi:MAG TPA: hypothetical protein VNV85_04385 [Puia sp.]|nr:hypothetical protein [Puia sp.]
MKFHYILFRGGDFALPMNWPGVENVICNADVYKKNFKHNKQESFLTLGFGFVRCHFLTVVPGDANNDATEDRPGILGIA